MKLPAQNDRVECSIEALDRKVTELQSQMARLEALLEGERTDHYQTRADLQRLKEWSMRTAKELPRGLPLR